MQLGPTAIESCHKEVRQWGKGVVEVTQEEGSFPLVNEPAKNTDDFFDLAHPGIASLAQLARQPCVAEVDVADE